MKRYAAKLLFQYRVIVDGDSGKRRTCEERIILLEANSAPNALRLAKRNGRLSQHQYKNSDGNAVHFEFVGVMELLFLEPVIDFFVGNHGFFATFELKTANLQV